MSSPIRTYAFINAKLRARISKLFTPEMFQKLIEARTLDETLASLHDTPYEVIEDIYKKTGDLKLGELELFGQEVSIYRGILRSLTGDAQTVVKALLLRYEIENLKDAMRLYFDKNIRGRSIEYGIHYLYRESIVYQISVDAIVGASGIEQIAGLLGKTPYGNIILNVWPQVENEKTLFPLEIALDRFYYRNLLGSIEHLSQRDRALIRRLVGIEIDLYNITWIIRAKHYYHLPPEVVRQLVISGGHRLNQNKLQHAVQTQEIGSVIRSVVPSNLPVGKLLKSTDLEDIAGNLTLLEQVLHEVMLVETKKALAGYPFTIGIVLAYSVLKRREIETVRTILNAKEYAIPNDRIKEMI